MDHAQAREDRPGVSRGNRRIGQIALAIVIILSLLPAIAARPAGASDSDDQFRVRVVHAIPDAGRVDVFVGDDRVLSGVPFFTVSGYLSLPAGDYDIVVVPENGDRDGPSIFRLHRHFQAGRDYSVVARGTANPSDGADIGALVLEDDNQAPGAGQARVRVAHLSPDAPAVDILVNGERAVQGLSYLETTGYLSLPAGRYTVEVAPAGGSPIFRTTLAVGAGQVVTAWANGLLGGTGAQAFTVTPSVDRPGAAPPPAGEARLRAVHAVPDLAGTPVDVYVNGTKALTFDFFTVSPYLTLPAGVYNLRVVPAGGNPETQAAITANVTLEAGKDYSAVARGTVNPSDSAPLGALLLEDDNQAPGAGQARVRVAHLSPDAPAVDILVNGERAVQGLSYLETTGYLSLPAGRYTVEVAPAGGSPIFRTTLAVGAGQVVTAWANGLLGGTGAQAFTVTPSVDRPGAAPPPVGEARLRVLHASPGAPAVDIFVDGARAVQNLSFGEITGYLTVPAGFKRVEVRPAGGSSAVFSAGITLAAGRDYTAAAIGVLGASDPALAFRVLLLEDGAPAAAAGQAQVRVVNLAPRPGAISLRADGEAALGAVGFGSASTFAPMAQGAVALDVLGSTSAPLMSTSAWLTAGKAVTVFVLGAGEGASGGVRLLVQSDANRASTSSGTRVFLPLAVR